MNTINPTTVTSRFDRTRARLRTWFGLQEGKATDAVIDETLRGGVEIKGPNLWILMFAIFVASIGLDVNSTAVIIGAMLISPLMGPIMGIGYGVGIYDFALIKRSLKYLLVATLISLVTSTVYFLVTPLSGEHSELLARTTPTIWDVLIALFGGLAGMVGVTRRERSNVIPGVAIATALMPPLCTAGYGLANGNMSFFFGAFYLFSINCVFIAVSTVVITWILTPPHKRFVDNRIERRVKHLVVAVVMLTAVPSVYLAYRLVQEEVFGAKAQQFVKDEMALLRQTHVAGTNVTPSRKLIEVTLIGERVDDGKLKEIAARLTHRGLAGSELVVHQIGDSRQQIDASSIKASIAGDLYQETKLELANRDNVIAQLQEKLQQQERDRSREADVAKELHAQYPQVTKVVLSSATQWDAVSGNAEEQEVTVVYLASAKPLIAAERRTIERWLQARLKTERISLFVGRHVS